LAFAPGKNNDNNNINNNNCTLSDTQVAMRATVTPGDLRLEGSWELAYTSSASFNLNQGFTGVAKTTPGGATFESLTQVKRLVVVVAGDGC